ncbi:aldehyde dehydrogenase [soil metagenome]
MIKLNNYINGELVSPVSGKYFENYDPATGEAFSFVPDSDENDIEKAVTAARNAFKDWSEMPVEKRSDFLFRIASLIEDRLEKFSLAESIDNGKPLTLARSVDIPRAVKNFEFFASAVINFSSESHSNPDSINYTLRQPVGIVGAISPWNLPLYLFTWKIAPALASGNVVIAKPSEITPFTAFLLADVCREAGLPPGVLNIIHGYGSKVGSAIVSHPEIKTITFTGGTETGRQIASVAAPMFKKLSLELGGKNPVIIFDNCDYDDMLETTVRSSFTNQGEICLCGSRIFIQNTIYEKFKIDFVERTKKLIIGDPLDPKTNIGAIVSKQHFDKLLSYIDLAVSEGGTILCGGKSVIPDTDESRCEKGFFIEPTIIEGLDFSCRTNMEEIFGPIVTILPFENEKDVIMMANSTTYGLASIVWNSDIKAANRVASLLNSGIIWINCWMMRDLRTPFGGMNNSGVGREGGNEALRFFTEPKNVCIKI